MKIALGTAQFGKPYGVANAAGQVAPEVVQTMLTLAGRAGVDTLDTAIAYGSSEIVLGNCGVAGWRIVTKLPPLPAGVSDVNAWVRHEISGSLDRLKVDQLDGVLLHRPSDLCERNGTALREALMSAKGDHLVSAVGVSIYSPAELDTLWTIFQPDIVQAPLNVLDRRLMRSGWMDRLHHAGVRVHTRSAFLQGLLLMSRERRPPYFLPWAKVLDQWLAWCRDNRCSTLQAALGFALAHPGVERVVVGVDSVAQLSEIVATAEQDHPHPPSSINCDDPGLIEPSRWVLD